MAPFRWRGLVAALAMLAVIALAAAPASALETRPLGTGPRPPTPTGILVNIASRTLYWYVEGKLVRSFPVGVGKPGSQTPVGRFAVQYKAKDPWWQPPWGGEPVPPGPSNPLGTRWIQFDGSYGIHGNNNPASIGQFVSLGCVRMYIPDVEWLYDQVRVGTPVTLVYEPVQLHEDAEGRRYLAVSANAYGLEVRDAAAVLREAGYAPDTVVVSSPGLYPLDITALVNGQGLSAIMHRGKPYIEARPLAGKMSARVTWNPAASTVSLDGQALPTVLRGRTGYVDAAAAAAVLGVDYEWDATGGLVRLTGQPLFLNGHLLSRNGRIIDSRLHLPVRQVAEAAGATVGWDQARGQALVNGEPVASVLRQERAFATADLLASRLHLGVELLDGAAYLSN